MARPDLYQRGHIPWKVTKVHDSVRHGVGTDTNILSYLLITNAESTVGPDIDVLIEIHRQINNIVQTEVGCWRILARITKHALLAQMKLSAPCTITHICDVWLNGRSLPHRGALLREADFLIIDMGERSQVRLPGVARETTNSDTDQEGTSDAEVGLAERPIARLGPLTYVVHRPRVTQYGPRTLWLATDTRSNIIFHIIERHWPDLQDGDYQMQAARNSLLADFVDGDVQHSILIADIDFDNRPLLRGVLVYLRIDKTQQLYAAALSTMTSEHALLEWAGISVQCRTTAGAQCGVWINGLRLRTDVPPPLAHYDYVKIAMWIPGTTRAQMSLLDVPDANIEEDIYDQESPFDALEPIQEDEVSNDGDTPHGTPSPQDQYWLMASAYAWLGGLGLLRLQVGNPGRKRRQRLQKAHTLKSWFLLGLISWNQIQSVATMMINTGQHAKSDETHYDQGKWNCLPPPGNTAEIDDPHACLQTTLIGKDMTSWISSQLMIKLQAGKIWDNLGFSPEMMVQRGFTKPLLPIQSEVVPIRLADHLPEMEPTTQADKDDALSVPLGTSTDDIDDLIIPWTRSRAPSLEELRGLQPELPDRLLSPAEDLQPDTIEIYTDGSFESRSTGHEEVATWAPVICGKKGRRDVLD